MPACGPTDPTAPPDTIDALEQINRATIASVDKLTWAVVPTDGGHPTLTNRASGLVSLTAIETSHGRAEIAAVIFARGLQRSRVTTEVHTLLIRHLIAELGYRRVEWKCDALNEPSRRAALRLGFRFEGTFAQHMVTRGRNRDTDYFALTDQDWTAIGAAHAAWLDPSNFDAQGHQRTSLRELIGR
ncbi:MAG: GNAT family N-acetyltransferase [Phycicoccus sp.]|nr:GNAT family N-acetyltransferase [Phycicoccus sp.]